MTKTANSLAGYIALLRQLALLCKVGSAIATVIARSYVARNRALFRSWLFLDKFR